MNLSRANLAAMALLLSGFCGLAIAGNPDTDYKAMIKAWRAKEYARALDLAEEFLAVNPDYKYASGALYTGGSAGLRSKQYARAEVMYRELIRRFPKYKKTDEGRNELVTVLSRARKLAECIEQCDENLAAMPDAKAAARWIYMKGETLFRLWRFEEAKAALEAFVVEHPESSLVRNARYYLDRIDPDWVVDENGIVAGYAGKYVGDVRLAAALVDLPKHVEAAYAGIRKRLGVDLRGKVNLVFRFEDAGARGGDRAYTATIARGGKPAIEMLFRTEYIVLSTTDFASRIHHEMKHAGFRQLMGQAYLNLPKWVKEGLAVYGADQLAVRESAILGDTVFGGGDPEKIVRRIDSRDFGLDDYLASALAFTWLESKQRGNVKRFCKRLLAGEDHREIFGDLAGMPVEKALEQAQEFARARVETLLGTGYREYRAVRDANFAAARKGNDARNAWLLDDGEEAYTAWLGKYKGHPLEPNARYRLGKALVYAGRNAEAREWLRLVAAEDFDRSSISDDAAFWIAESWDRQGDEKQAREAFGALLRDFSWATNVTKKVDEGYQPAGPVTKVK